MRSAAVRRGRPAVPGSRSYAAVRRFDRLAFHRHVAAAERAVEDDDAVTLVASWLALAKEQMPLKDERTLGYRPMDRLSGFDELRPGSEAFTDGVVQALEEAVSFGDPWACWSMAQRRRHGVGVRASAVAAVQHARAAAEGGVADAQAHLSGWLLDTQSHGDARRDGNAWEEGLRWCEEAAAAGHRAAHFRLGEVQAGREWASLVRAPTVAHTSPPARVPATMLELEWGAARYNDTGWEGWGALPLLPTSDPSAMSAKDARDFATDNGLLVPPMTGLGAGIGSGSKREHEKLVRQLNAQLSPRLVVTLYNGGPWADTVLRYNTALTTWAAQAMATPLRSPKWQQELRLGVAASLAEQLWEHRARATARGGGSTEATMVADEAEKELEPWALAPRLRLLCVFAHVDALMPPLDAPPAPAEAPGCPAGPTAASGGGGGGGGGGGDDEPVVVQLFPGEPELHYELTTTQQKEYQGPLRWLEGRRIVVTLARPAVSSIAVVGGGGAAAFGRPKISSVSFRQMGQFR